MSYKDCYNIKHNQPILSYFIQSWSRTFLKDINVI